MPWGDIERQIRKGACKNRRVNGKQHDAERQQVSVASSLNQPHDSASTPIVPQGNEPSPTQTPWGTAERDPCVDASSAAPVESTGGIDPHRPVYEIR